MTTDISISKLERSKAKRRDAILDAARELVKQGDEDALSMRTLAKNAGVSLATPYNLFGSKQSVMVALCKREVEPYLAKLQSSGPKGAIDRLFGYIDSVFEMYQSDPGYSRTLLASLSHNHNADVWQELRGPHIAFLRRLLRDAVAAQELGSKISIELAGRQMFGLNLFFVQEWIYGNITLERARIETEFGFSVILYALANDHMKEALLARNLELEVQLD